MHYRLTRWLLPLLVVVVAAPAQVSAEGFADLFLGAAITQQGDIDLTYSGVTSTFQDKSYQTSVLVGGRVGWWWSIFGLNFDASYFRPELDPDEATLIAGTSILNIKTDLDVVGLGFNAMLRGQFAKDSEVPQGRLQPYLFAGPTLFISTFDIKAKLTQAGRVTTANSSDTDTRVGVTIGGGVTYMFTKSIGAFSEYRFTYNKPEFEINGLKIEPTLNTHHFLAGVTFRF